MSLKIVYEGLYEDQNKRCASWDRKPIPENYEIDGDSLIKVLDRFEGKKVRLTVEEVFNE